MIRTDEVSNFKALDVLEAFADAYPELAQEAVKSAVERYKAPFLDELRHYPPRVKYPIAWQSERQRKAFFATDGFGQGIPTRRTFKLRDGWNVYVDFFKDGATVNVTNSQPYTPFVVGKLRAIGADWQQRFHKNSGWPEASVTIDSWIEDFRQEALRQLNEYWK